MIKSHVPICTKTWNSTNCLPMFFDVLPKNDQDLYLTIQMFKESVYFLCDLLGIVNEDMTIDEVCDKLYEQEECLRAKIEQIKFYNQEVSMNTTMEDIMDIMDRKTVYETPSCFYAIHKPNRLLVRTAIPGEVLHTLNGNVTANEGDYVITGVNGEQYPCDPEIFKKLYDIE